MKVICKSNRIEDASNDARLYELLTSKLHFSTDHQFALTCGKSYVVYALMVQFGYPWFFVADDEFMSYPMAYPGPFFDVTDRRLAACWRFGSWSFEEESEEPMILFTFDEWASDYSFYERLVDSGAIEKDTFKKYKRLMDTEENVSGTSLGRT